MALFCGQGRLKGTCLTLRKYWERSNRAIHGLEELLPLVYSELRKLAAAGMAANVLITLQATALVHEAYMH